MTDGECRAMLARRNVARFACAVNNQPYIVPIHISDELISHGQWASVIVSGRYEELPNTLGVLLAIRGQLDQPR
jgi:nitroimidazol reductase NimA-like FMN-containing flavoprotein (pyridoxamine 5'-phosphate oxidase superfamily)